MQNFIAGKDDHGVSNSRIPGESVTESCVEASAGGSCGDLMSLIVTEAKVYALVVLALCTTIPPVGITLSAFLLLFPESVDKPCAYLMEHCSNVKPGLEYVAKRIGYAILVLTGDVTVKEKSDGVVFERVKPAVGSEYEPDSDSSAEDIEVVQVNCSSARVRFDEGRTQKTSLIEFLVVDDEKWKKIHAGDPTDDGSVKKSRITRIRKKIVPKMGAELIKKIVPKKLRRKSKKHQSGMESEPEPLKV